MDEAGARASVVVADDDEFVLRALGRIVQGAGYRVALACEGAEAVRMCRELRPRLLLVDRDMPPPRYPTIARTLRTELGTDAPRIVVVTGNVELSCPEEVDGVLAKPFRVAEIVLLLKRFAG
ncbi:MAG: response regulator [Deltaproteobacteria bacterium]|nr:response regulator [Deltaproteobacteria bacterium]